MPETGYELRKGPPGQSGPISIRGEYQSVRPSAVYNQVMSIRASLIIQALPSSTFPLPPLPPFPQPLLRRHKLPNPHRYPLKQILSWCRRRTRPQALTPAPIIVHTPAGARHFRPMQLLFWISPRGPRPTVGPGLRFAQPQSPPLDLVPVVVPHAVQAAAHAAVVGLGGTRGDGDAVDGAPG